MVRILDKIWIRFGVYVTLSVFITLSIVVAFALWSDAHAKKLLFEHLPPAAQIEMLELIKNNREHSARADEIYYQYGGDKDPGTPALTAFGFGLSLFLGLFAAFVSAHFFVRPLASLRTAALAIAQGNFQIRAESLKGRGELSELIDHFNQMADSLDRLERERQETVASMSHELRTPLTILQGRLHALCDGVIKADQQEFLRLLDQTKHLVRLVDDMHTLSLVEANRFALNLNYLELGSFLQEIASFFIPRANSFGVVIDIKTETVFVHCDRDRLRQVITNIIENALHYAAKGKCIAIRVAQENDLALLEIRDRGPGIVPAELALIFNAFFRSTNTTTKEKAGSGLGLAIVQTIIKQHGGTVEVANDPKGGAIFKIQLPLAQNS